MMRLSSRTRLCGGLAVVASCLALTTTLPAQSLTGFFNSNFIPAFGQVSDNTVPSFTLDRSGSLLPQAFVSDATTHLTANGVFTMNALTLDVAMDANSPTRSGGGDFNFSYIVADTLSFDHTSNLDLVLRLTSTLDLGTDAPEAVNNWAKVATTIRFDTSMLDDPTYTWYYNTSTQAGALNNISTADIALTLTPGATLSFTTGMSGQIQLSLNHAGVTDLDGWIDGTLGWEIVSLSDPTVNVSSLSGANYLSASLSAVPEPSTYGLLVGAAILGTVLWRRRRTGTATAA
ncbi:PEP-CTERM sorting domain-containing protein [Actomonas aquatica]|uniref:PEP-CTERM sorting domain-containing protein n=1 Tax=Actomonas aquatica TaxID=2866162 RepID=A0ABZ1C3T3_9BACT|nr:PEP-CTERM sorting domain-containing protein [Opitutus sp. WL0086]WRQ86017.1 PEP-CTERM sorting domain-containing protein [Opitutus sp. WL0086]